MIETYTKQEVEDLKAVYKEVGINLGDQEACRILSALERAYNKTKLSATLQEILDEDPLGLL